VLLALVLALVLAACTSEPPADTATGPDQQIAAFISAWQQDNPDAAADFTSDPAAELNDKLKEDE
jgi:ABC-type glycerol-3-phosphate transport system substrate-binding protein